MLDNKQPKRYNRTFIGLMEQCNDGEWMKYDEALSVVKEFKDLVDESTLLFDDLHYEYYKLERKYLELQTSNNITQIVTLATLVSFAGFLVARFIYG